MAIYPPDPKPATVSVDDIKRVACPILSQEARHLVEPVTYHIQWMTGNGDGTTRLADDEHVVAGPHPGLQGREAADPQARGAGMIHTPDYFEPPHVTSDHAARVKTWDTGRGGHGRMRPRASASRTHGGGIDAEIGHKVPIQ
jgi:hypothetical protein